MARAPGAVPAPRAPLPDGELARRFLALPLEQRVALSGRLTGEELVQLEADLDWLVRADLYQWCRVALAPEKQVPARHHRLLISELEMIASGANDRLMITMPPGHAKSKYASVMFPAWFMAQAPHLSVIGASAGSDLATTFSRRILDLIRVHSQTLGYGLRSEAAQTWLTTNGGEYFAAGVGTKLAGRRADLAIADDLIGKQEDGDSAEYRQRVWDWWQADFLTRLKLGGRVVLINTRWNEDDLSGRLLEIEPEKWRLVNLPAIAEEDDQLGRDVGEALWPDQHPLAKLLDLQRSFGGEDSRTWTSLYQQRPAPAGGALFMVDKIGVVDVLPPIVRRVRAWDLAATEAGAVTRGGKNNDPDWTVGLLLAKTAQGRWLIEDVTRFRGRPEEVERRIKETAQKDGRGVEIGLPQDPGAAGKSYSAYLVSQLAGWSVKVSTESGSKATRAAAVVSQVDAGNLTMLRAGWNLILTNELRVFPAGRNDDQVDALSRAFLMLAGGSLPAQSMSIGWGAR